MLNYLLTPLSALYYAGYLLDKSLTEPKTLPKKVVSVGNITWGGTGKTSVVVKLAGDLLGAGKRVAVLSRGYKRKLKVEGERLKANDKEPLVVADGKRILANPDEAGDEPYMMAEKLRNVPILVDADRHKAGLYATEKFSPDVFILDDGFQHWGLFRDLDVVCVNAANPFGNGFLIPAGILREPLSALSRADLILITNSNIVAAEKLEDLKKKISKYTKSPIVLAVNEFIRIIDIFTDQPVDLNKNENIVAFSAIGSNENFKTTLEMLGYATQKFYSFTDHHRYSSDDLKKIIDENPESVFLTTRKDAVKIKFLENRYDNFYYLDVGVKITEGEDIWLEKIRRLF